MLRLAVVNDMSIHKIQISSPLSVRTTLKSARWAMIFSGLFALLFALAPQRSLADSGKDAEKFFKAQNQKVMGLLKQSPSSARSKKLDALLGNLLDYDALAKRSLAKHWDERSADEQNEFVGILRSLVSKNYRENLKTTASYKLTYKGHEAKGDGILVKTTAKSKTDKRAPALELDYLLVRSKKTWKVVDIVTDGVSLVSNYKKQFNRIIKKKGWDGLVAKMKKKLKG